MSDIVYGLRGHVAPCFCDACVNERVAAIDASTRLVVIEDGPAPDLTDTQRADLRAWASRNIRPFAWQGSWHPDDPVAKAAGLNRQQRRRAILDGHHRSALRAVAFYRAEAREGRAHAVDSALWPFIADAHNHPLAATPEPRR